MGAERGPHALLFSDIGAGKRAARAAGEMVTGNMAP